MKRIVLEGSLIPNGYGFAWRNWADNSATFYPIPLNFVLRLGRDFYYWLAKVGGSSYRREEEAYLCGRNEILQSLDRVLEQRFPGGVAKGEK